MEKVLVDIRGTQVTLTDTTDTGSHVVELDVACMARMRRPQQDRQMPGVLASRRPF